MFFDHVQENVRRRISGKERIVEKPEVATVGESSRSAAVFLIPDERRDLRYLVEGPDQFLGGRTAEDVDVDRQSPDDRDMEQQARAALEHEIEAAFREMTEQCQRVQRPFEQCRISGPDLPTLGLQPVDRETVRADHYLPIISTIESILELMGYFCADDLFSSSRSICNQNRQLDKTRT